MFPMTLEKKVGQLRENIFANLTRWQRVQLARHPERPYTLDYIQQMTTDFVELHGDRTYGDDKAIVGGFAKLGDQPVMIIGHQKGRDTKSNLYRNFGMPNPEGYRKALRLMKLAAKFKRPIITMLDRIRS
jgi:acetyl-CoA carboxylase carboxyl transferase subunit alpha